MSTEEAKRRILELETALMPFAQLAAKLDRLLKGAPDNHGVAVDLGSLRKARAVLEEEEDGARMCPSCGDREVAEDAGGTCWECTSNSPIPNPPQTSRGLSHKEEP